MTDTPVNTRLRAALASHPLPADMGNLLRVALVDAKSAERSKRYELNMSTWHTPTKPDDAVPEQCTVCLAGAVIRRHLRPTDVVGPFDYRFPTDLWWRMQALDHLRNGQVMEAWQESAPVQTKYYEGVSAALTRQYSRPMMRAQTDGWPHPEWWTLARALRDDLLHFRM